jgi:hypothetical protein
MPSALEKKSYLDHFGTSFDRRNTRKGFNARDDKKSSNNK